MAQVTESFLSARMTKAAILYECFACIANVESDSLCATFIMHRMRDEKVAYESTPGYNSKVGD